MSTEYFRLTKPVAEAPKTGLSWPWQIFLFLIAAAAVVSRRPDAVLHAQFFAEDGMFWYADAYNIGWLHALFIPHTGYFQTLPRLTAALSLLLPLQFAPLLLNAIAIVIQVLPATLLLSSRLALWGPLYSRALMAAFYIALPNSHELDAAITEAQWHLALLAVLVVLAIAPQKRIWRAFDAITVIMSGLTGPFCLALFPISAFLWWKQRDRWRALLTGLLALCFVVQISALLLTGASTRSQAALGASPTLFFRMLAGDVYLGAIAGENHFAVTSHGLRLVLVGLLGSATLLYCFAKVNLPIRLFLVYCFTLFAASLKNPMISYDLPQWQVLASTPGLRYWFFPSLAFVWSAVWCAASAKAVVVRVVAGATLLFMLSGVRKDWNYPSFTDEDFPARAKQFESLPSGHVMEFALYPPGWTMQLTKNASMCGELPTGFVDQPKNGAAVSRVLLVAGWVISPEPAPRLNIFIDGILRSTALPSILRRDVDVKYPNSATKIKGWQVSVDVNNLSTGAHATEVIARLHNGCEAVIGSPSFKITPTPLR